MRLDTFLNGAGIRRVHYLKIDAQGADFAVIRSAGERLRDIDRISLEVQTTPFELYRVRRARKRCWRIWERRGSNWWRWRRRVSIRRRNMTFVRSSRG